MLRSTASLSPRAAAGLVVRLGAVLAWIGAVTGPAAATEPGSRATGAASELGDAGAAPIPAYAPPAKPEWHRRLAGIVISRERRTALFALPGDTRSVGLGEQIDGWLVTEIRPDGVTIEAAGETRQLTPEAEAPGDARPVPTARPPASAAHIEQRRQEAAAEAALAAATAKMTGH